MVGIIATMGVRLRHDLIEENLSVGKRPISEGEHEDWRAFQE